MEMRSANPGAARHGHGCNRKNDPLGITLFSRRIFSLDAREIVVSRRLASEFSLEVGSTVRLSAVDWGVSEHFANNSAFEFELWAVFDAVWLSLDWQDQMQSLSL